MPALNSITSIEGPVSSRTGADLFVFSDGTVTAPSSFHADVITDFSPAQGELRYRLEASTGDTIVEMDLNGDGVRDMSIRLTGTHDLVAGDFLL